MIIFAEMRALFASPREDYSKNRSLQEQVSDVTIDNRGIEWTEAYG